MYWSGEMACAAPTTAIDLERAAGAERARLQTQVGGSADADGSGLRLVSSASTWVGMPEADVAKLLVGVTIRKRFLQYGTFDGLVMSFDEKTAKFAVKYSDGDEGAMSLAQLAKWLPQEYVMLAKEYLYLGEGSKRRELPGAGRIRATTGGKFARKEAKGKTNEGKDATAVVGAAGESWNKKARPAPVPKDAGGSASQTIETVKTGAASQPNRAWISRFASMQQNDSAHSVLASDSPHSEAVGAAGESWNKKARPALAPKNVDRRGGAVADGNRKRCKVCVHACALIFVRVYGSIKHFEKSFRSPPSHHTEEMHGVCMRVCM